MFSLHRRWARRVVLGMSLPALSGAIAPSASNPNARLGAAIDTSAFAPGNGQLYVWGLNSSNQLGFSAREYQQLPPTRKPLPLGVHVAQVVGVANSMVILTTEGTVYGWGANHSGELGTGSSHSTDEHTYAALMPADVRFVELVAGDGFVLGLTATGLVYAWGGNNRGQLGLDPSAPPGAYNPRQPTLITMPKGVRFAHLAASRYHCLGLSTDGSVYAWGSNGYGELGRGTADQLTHFMPEPVQLPAGTRILEVAAGAYHALALAADGTLYTWGINEQGQLGLGTADTQPHATPTPVPLPADVRFQHIYSGTFAWFSLATTPEGKLYAWGSNNSGQLGLGHLDDQSQPRAVSLPGNSPCVSVACATSHTLALTADNRVYAWGSNGAGQVSPTAQPRQLTPIRVAIPHD
jgi:alpha-tubulin suppressor-like RCC1 family protein